MAEATGYSELRDYQKKTIQAYLSCRDLFVPAPTGSGKSLTLELAPYNFDRLLGEDCNTIVFVIVPLILLMKNLVSSLNCRGITVSYMYVGDNCSKQQLQDILNGGRQVLSPLHQPCCTHNIRQVMNNVMTDLPFSQIIASTCHI